MARPNIQHHKVPRIYLQGFTNSEGKVWVIDRNFSLYSQIPEKTLTERDYYLIKFPNGGGTLEVETKYLSHIEGHYANIYRSKISPKLLLTKKEKAQLSVFIASMIARQPIRRLSIEKFFEDVREKVEHLRALPISVKKQMFAFPNFSTSESIPADEFLKIGEDIGSLHTSLIPESVPETANTIFEMDWTFIVNPFSDNPYLSSDKPCTLMNPVGEAKYGRYTIGAMPDLLQNDVELTIPLSSEVALFCSWSDKEDCCYIKADTSIVDDINRRTKRNAQNIICSNRNILERILESTKIAQKSKT